MSEIAWVIILTLTKPSSMNPIAANGSRSSAISRMSAMPDDSKLDVPPKFYNFRIDNISEIAWAINNVPSASCHQHRATHGSRPKPSCHPRVQQAINLIVTNVSRSSYDSKSDVLPNLS